MSANADYVASEILLYCRAGFEADLAAEIAQKAAVLGATGYPIAAANTGFVRYVLADHQPAHTLQKQLSFETLVFPRQTLVAFPPLANLDRENRISPVMALIRESGWSFEHIYQDLPDTNDGKALTGLGKSIQKALESASRKCGALRRKAGKRWLHLFWTAGDQVQVAISFPGNRSEYPNGIRHLRFPHDAPSRSTLKLEEAWHTFIAPGQWDELLGENMWAADLGAAPGGWTWQLVKRGMSVYAIDNGSMQTSLMKTGQVEHLRADAYNWKPPHTLDWLVCDMVDQPARVARLMGAWLENGWTRRAVFNLKLPMKQRWQEVEHCLELLHQCVENAGFKAHIRCRHLYHDREEVTVYVAIV